MIKLISQVIADFADGEISQAAKLFDTNITLEAYLEKSFYKTASLIAAACRCAAVFSDCSPEGELWERAGGGAGRGGGAGWWWAGREGLCGPRRPGLFLVAAEGKNSGREHSTCWGCRCCRHGGGGAALPAARAVQWYCDLRLTQSCPACCAVKDAMYEYGKHLGLAFQVGLGLGLWHGLCGQGWAASHTNYYNLLPWWPLLLAARPTLQTAPPPLPQPPPSPSTLRAFPSHHFCLCCAPQPAPPHGPTRTTRFHTRLAPPTLCHPTLHPTHPPLPNPTPQVVDDILDFTQSSEALGKPQGQDLASGNLTAPVLFALQVRWRGGVGVGGWGVGEGLVVGLWRAARLRGCVNAAGPQVA